MCKNRFNDISNAQKNQIMRCELKNTDNRNHSSTCNSSNLWILSIHIKTSFKLCFTSLGFKIKVFLNKLFQLFSISFKNHKARLTTFLCIDFRFWCLKNILGDRWICIYHYVSIIKLQFTALLFLKIFFGEDCLPYNSA